jgi:hypothetical protein
MASVLTMGQQQMLLHQVQLVGAKWFNMDLFAKLWPGPSQT